MNRKDSEKFADLRQKAEQTLAESSERVEEIPTDIRQLIRELQVRSVELEMQNEQLRKAQIEVEDSRERYAELYDFAPVGYITMDSNGFIVQANLAICAMLRIQRNVLLKMPFRDYLETSHWYDFEEHLRLVSETLSKQTCELELVISNRSKVDVEMVTVPIDSPDDDDALWYRAVLTDMGERKKRAEALQQAYEELDLRVEERTKALAGQTDKLKAVVLERERLIEELASQTEILQTVMDNIPVMIALYNRSGEFSLVNREFERNLGWPAEELNKIDAMAELHPDPRQRKEAWEYMMKAVRDWKDFSVKTRRGKHLDSLWSNVLLSDGSQIGIGIDISERRAVEKALQKSEEQHRLLVQNLPGVVYRGKKDWAVEFIDEKVEALTGYKGEEFCSGRKKWSDLIPEEDFKSAKEAFVRALRKDRSFVREYRIRCRDGNIIWVQDRGTIVCDEKGEILYVNGVFFDITERKKFDKELEDNRLQIRSMASELVLTEERQRRILAQDLHDSIGQNLALSKLRVDSMRSGTGAGKISSELESLSRNLEDAIEQIQSLIFKLSPPILYQVGLGAALEYLAEWVEETYDIRIAVNTETNCPSIPEDESVLLFRAVQELLTNTVKHSEASNSSITLRGSDDHVYIEVQDNGTGFDTGILEGKRPLKDRFGLLSIKERLQHLGGHTRVESSSGRGTKVCMWAPLRTETKNTEVIREN